jgi:hypothetical protein
VNANLPTTPAFPPSFDSYGDAGMTGVWAVLVHRVQVEPFNLVATVIFLLAILHTFFAPALLHLSHAVQRRYEGGLARENGSLDTLPSIPAAFLHFIGEVEVIFGIWVIPLAIALLFAKGPAVTRTYFDQDVDYSEALFVVIVMAIASSRPIVQLAIRLLGLLAGRSVLRWWVVVLTLGPLMGSLITEPAAMTICAVMLGREFYRLGPSPRFCYATLGLLFVNISVGGSLTNFAAPPILLVSGPWHWSTLYMLQHFGLRVVPGILACNLLYFLVFRRELIELGRKKIDDPPTEEPVPAWITAVHLAFLGWTVLVSHEPALFIGPFFFFLAFTWTTAPYQDEIKFRSPMLVGFFLAGLVIHGGLQAWWIEPVLSHLTEFPLLLGATVLTAFNDNASITYLATLVPGFTEHLKNAVVAGAICGGGLTVIANAPNPAGQSILEKYFPEGVSPLGLFLAALGPTLVMLVFFAV